jgi:hypothetical protein
VWQVHEHALLIVYAVGGQDLPVLEKALTGKSTAVHLPRLVSTEVGRQSCAVGLRFAHLI